LIGKCLPPQLARDAPNRIVYVLAVDADAHGVDDDWTGREATGTDVLDECPQVSIVSDWDRPCARVESRVS
jgi:hypothetical protein